MPPKSIPTDDELKLEARQALIDVMRNATKPSPYFEVVCRECGKRQKVQVPVPDNTNVVKAAGEIIDRLEGRAATKKEAPKVKTSGRSLDELTDDELEAIINGEQEEAEEGPTESKGL